MVENQFLERLNLLFQHVLKNNLPFGGKQVIFLGDFHQLPPVKPFAHCLRCGQIIPQKDIAKCTSPKCVAQTTSFASGDKWAFKSSVWKDLNLLHIKLEQIHRQKDTNFQDILNKIRNGDSLSADEWNQLERPKELPPGAYPIRLMSKVAQVQAFNEQKLAELKSQPKSWKAYDHAAKLLPGNPIKAQDHKSTLKDHRFPADLTLKVGARVVLLQNLSHDRGLVNGSQGVVIGFAHSPNELAKVMEKTGPHVQYQVHGMKTFQSENTPMRPLVRFANGATELITPVAQSAMRGDPLDPHQQYVVTRTQVPLILAWALSIHKSQGMTLEYVEVSSRDIFESGQLYVALSRATHLNGLKVTGFKREQLPMDMDVMKFYNETKWEKLERPQNMKESVVIDLT
jgi:ATP-dependent DNA helicase PIF1